MIVTEPALDGAWLGDGLRVRWAFVAQAFERQADVLAQLVRGERVLELLEILVGEGLAGRLQ